MPASWMDSANLGSWEEMAGVIGWGVISSAIGSSCGHTVMDPWRDQNHREQHLIERDSAMLV